MKIAVEEWELYNNGYLLIKWFDTEIDTIEDIEAYISKIKASYRLNSDDMELFIADYEAEYPFNSECVLEAYRISEIMDSLSEDEQTAVKIMLDNYIVNSIDEALEHIEDLICTNETSMDDIAYNYVNNCGLLDTMPENLRYHFDYEALGRDMEINGSYYEDNDSVLWEYVAC